MHIPQLSRHGSSQGTTTQRSVHCTSVFKSQLSTSHSVTHSSHSDMTAVGHMSIGEPAQWGSGHGVPVGGFFKAPYC